jgi:transposase
MTAQRSRLDFSGQTIFVGVDVSNKSWSVSIFSAQGEHKTFCQPPQAQVLVNYLQRNFPGAEYRCVYEAGYSGFWPHQALTEAGVQCLVVNPADVPTKGHERRRRRDPVDSRKLARALRNGELLGVYVPSRSAQEARSLVRQRHELVKKQTRCKNQIWALLRFYGYQLPEELQASRWSGAFIAHLHALLFVTASGRQSLDLLLLELAYLRALIAGATVAIRKLSKQECYRERVRLLLTVPGVGALTAMTLLVELVDLSRFKNADQLASYVGLVPDEDSSGDSQLQTGLTRRRNAHLRHLLVECAWVALRKDPALLHKFEQLTAGGQMKKTQAIIRLARKLLCRIRRVLVTGEPYVLGVIE